MQPSHSSNYHPVLPAALLLPVCFAALFFAEPTFAQQEAANLSAAQEKLIADPWNNDERMPYHLDSIIGLAILAFACSTALLLNNAAPRLRALGTLLAAGACLAVGFTLYALGAIGALTEVRPPLFPIDPAKPTFLLAQQWCFLLAGSFLALVAFRRVGSTDTLTLGPANEANRYGRHSRALHWVTAILILVLIPMGIFTSMIPEEVWYRQAYYVIHKSLGLTVLLLVFVRIVWHRHSPKPAHEAGLKSWEVKLAKGVHWLLYLLMIGLPLSGLLLSTFAGKLSHFYFWDLPPMGTPSRDNMVPFAIAHKLVLPGIFYLVFLSHIAGVIKHRYIDGSKESVQRMVG